jgi:fermentation-respiration switch protein FrsA (DUF1100 family)
MLKKRWARVLVILAAFLVMVFLGISVYLGYSMTRVVRVPVTGSPADLGLKYEDVSFTSAEDNLELRGWLLAGGDNGKIIIMLHGSDGNRNDTSIATLDIAAELVKHGYSVLMFDLRGHGESEGNRLSAGYLEQRDLLGAIDFVEGRGFHGIGAIGFSMGAATAILTSAENTAISCIVSDSCFADITEIMKREFAERTKVPGFFLQPMLFMVKLFYGVDFNAVKPVEAVSRIASRPVLFIHGADDTFVPPEHASRLLQAAQNPVDELWIAPNAEHVKSYSSNPGEYMARVIAFYDKTLQ